MGKTFSHASMKCLFAIKRLHNLAGGAERVMCTICSSLAQKGYSIQIITFDSQKSTPFYYLPSKVKLINLGLGNSANSTNLWEAIGRFRRLRQILLEERSKRFQLKKLVPCSVRGFDYANGYQPSAPLLLFYHH